MFHGTGNVPPNEIYSCSEGIDFRYAAEGMWGRASYFCDDVRMANYFAYNVPNSNLKQILMLRLLAGRTIELEADPALLLPPSIPQENNNYISRRFDTVIGRL